MYIVRILIVSILFLSIDAVEKNKEASATTETNEEKPSNVLDSEKFFFDRCKIARDKMKHDKKFFGWFHKECTSQNPVTFNDKRGNLPIPSDPPVLRDIESDLTPLKPISPRKKDI